MIRAMISADHHEAFIRDRLLLRVACEHGYLETLISYAQAEDAIAVVPAFCSLLRDDTGCSCEDAAPVKPVRVLP